MEWTEQAEDLLKTHKKDMQQRLTSHASTTPWDEIIMGSIGQIKNNSPYKSKFKINNMKQVSHELNSPEKHKHSGLLDVDKKYVKVF